MSRGIRSASTGQRVTIAAVAGVIIASVDNFAFGGEVSPVLIVGMLLAATGVAGYLWGASGAAAVAIIWVFVPAAHLVNLALGLPDSLHPHTYGSAMKLAAFTAIVAVFGAACGAAIGGLLPPVMRFPRR